jgi:hypothetical protein
MVTNFSKIYDKPFKNLAIALEIQTPYPQLCMQAAEYLVSMYPQA